MLRRLSVWTQVEQRRVLPRLVSNLRILEHWADLSLCETFGLWLRKGAPVREDQMERLVAHLPLFLVCDKPLRSRASIEGIIGEFGDLDFRRLVGFWGGVERAKGFVVNISVVGWL